jgi:hypothetical protein
MWPRGQVWKPGPASPATVAAWPPVLWFRIRVFCSRGSLIPDFINGRRPHPSTPRHDNPNRPLGGERSTLADETSAFPAGVQHRPTRRRRSRRAFNTGRRDVGVPGGAFNTGRRDVGVPGGRSIPADETSAFPGGVQYRPTRRRRSRGAFNTGRRDVGVPGGRSIPADETSAFPGGRSTLADETLAFPGGR